MTDRQQAKAKALEAIKAVSEDLIAISKAIHARPELAMEEHEAARLLADWLEGQGFVVERKAYGLETAFRATWGEGPVSIAYLAEYDALPEIGHACGHNLIAAVGVGGAAGLKGALSPTEVRIVVLGTPAEENIGGKIMMLERGAFRDVDVALMAHPSPADVMAPPMYGLEQMEVEYRGRASHASLAPEAGINALDALVLAYQAIAQLRQHIRRDARIHGIITYGGAAANVVPERATGRFIVRALEPGYLQSLKEQVIRCFQAGATATGAELKLEWGPWACAPMKNNLTLANAYRANAEALGRRFIEASTFSTGSSDMGNVSQALPSIHPVFGIGAGALNHTAAFTEYAATDAAHENMLQVAQALAMTGCDIVLDPDLLRQAKQEFAGR